ncbi:MAG: site-2 protease family protein [Patescibacteria group bacterium]
MNIIIFIIILLVLVLVHEAGHFFTAKGFGVRVDEFGFGFPPKMMTLFKKGETEYTLNWLPIGGFVKIFGEDPNEENTNGPEASRSFVNKPRWQQAIVLFAGIAANFLLAWLLFSIGFMTGLPTSVQSAPKDVVLQNTHLTVLSVLKDSPAEIAGLKTGDKIVAVKSFGDANTVKTLDQINPEAFTNFIRSQKDTEIEEVEISYLRGNDATTLTAKMIPKLNAENNPIIGISMDEIGILKLPFFSAFVEGMKLDWNVTKATVVGLFSIIKQAVQGENVSSSLTGPVGMVSVVGDASKFGFAYLISFAALISVNLAVINLLPFPALDGGRLLFLLIEKIRGKRLNQNFANTANMIGFWLLILLMVYITYKDIAKLL